MNAIIDCLVDAAAYVTEDFCHTFSRYRWARKLCGGKWEEWWADIVCAYVWLQVDEFHAPGTRPGGCAVWDSNPKPRNREDYTKDKGTVLNG